MKQKLTPKWFIIKLTGILFAVYSVYNIFIIFKDRSSLPREGIIISAIIAVLFALLAGFALTSEVRDLRFLTIRITVFPVALLAVFLLKLRMVIRNIEFIDFTKPYTVLNGGAYFATLTALIILFIYYAFILRRINNYPKASVILPLTAMLLFVAGFVMEIILFFGFKIGIEANLLRTVVIRPVFYLSFIGLSAYFLFPAQPPKQ